MKKIINNRILCLLIGIFGIVFGGISLVIAADILINADQVTYKSTTVADALDELLNASGGCPLGYDCDAKEYTITFETNGGTPVSDKKVMYDEPYGELPMALKLGYSLEWCLDEELTKVVTKDTIVKTARNHTLYAKWTESEISTITFNVGDVGSVNPTSKEVTVGAAYGELPTPTRPSYAFEGWYLEETYQTQITNETIVHRETSAVLYAKWSRSLYQLIANQTKGKLAVSAYSQIEDGNNGTNGVYEYDETLGANADGGSLPIYYFRGKVTNNNVYFAGKCWLIIRTTSTGGVKLIYNGTGSATSCTGTNPAITTKGFCGSYNEWYHLLYTSDRSSWLGIGQNSDIKTYVEGDGLTAIGMSGENNQYYAKLEDTPFCMDRRYGNPPTRQTAAPGKNTGIGPRVRAQELKKPDLSCQEEDKLTTSHGLSKKVGLITSDEIMLAGGYWNTANSGYYLYTGSNWWSLSPCSRDSSGSAYVMDVNSNGNLYNDGVLNVFGVRPVVSLSNSTEISEGTGDPNSPFQIKMN